MKQTGIIYETPSQPRQLRLDTIAGCNATCLSCHRFLNKRKGQMDMGLLLSILKDVARWESPLVECVPVNYGEFFLRKDWYNILKLISSNLPNTQIVLPTNGSLLDEDVVKKLADIETLFLVNFSVNAFFEDTYEQFTGLPYKTIEKIERAIRLLREWRKDVVTWVSMVFDPMYQTDLERDNFLKHWSGISDKVWAIPAASARRPEKKPTLPVKLPCRSIFSDIVVGFDGKLSSCCFDSGFTLDLDSYGGDLKKDWTNNKLTELRKSHNEHQRSGICEECTFA